MMQSNKVSQEPKLCQELKKKNIYHPELKLFKFSIDIAPSLLSIVI